MLHERRGCLTDNRVGGYLTQNPVNGGAVVYSRPYFAVNPPYGCLLAESLVQRELVSPAYDLAYLFNIADEPVYGCDRDYSYYGHLYQTDAEITSYLWRLNFVKSSFAHNVLSLFGGRWDRFHGSRVSPLKKQGENPVIHNNLFGAVSSQGLDSVMRTYAPTELVPEGYVVRSLDPLRISLSPTIHLVSPIGDLVSWIKQIDAPSQYDGFTAPVLRYYPLFQWATSEDGGLTVSYRYGVQYDNSGANRRDVNIFVIRFSYAFTPTLFTPELGIAFPATAVIQATCKIEWWLAAASWCTPITNPAYPDVYELYDMYAGQFPEPFGDWSSLSSKYTEERALTVSPATNPSRGNFDAFLGYSNVLGKYEEYTPNGFRNFVRTSDVVLKESFNVLQYPYADAIETQFSRMKSNHLEALSELGSILDPIDLIKLARVLPSYVAKKGVLVVRILDLLTSARLLYSFGIAPTISDAEDVARRAKAFRARVLGGDAFKSQTTYGSYVIELEEGNPLEVPPCTVELRSKVRTRYLPDSLLTAAITADSVQLLPTLSNLWDLVPLSFVLDWFFPVGKGLSAVDNQAKILALDCAYCVHTISVIQYIGDDVLVPLGYKDVSHQYGSNGGVGYRKYVRIVDDSAPILGPTKLPVITAPGVPNYWTAGSLAYKKIS